MRFTCKAFLVGLVLVSLLGAVPVTPHTETAPVQNAIVASGENWLNYFDYRRNITLTGVTGAGTGYQVLVNITYNSSMQVNFGDIRFTDDDGDTELTYWMQEHVNSSYAVFWVKVNDDLGSNQIIYIYYGNNGVTTTSNGYATFEFFEDWEEGSVNATRWDTDDSGGSSSFSTTNAHHGNVHRIQGGAANGIQSYSTTANTSSETAVLFRAHLEETVTSFEQVRLGQPNKIVFESNYGTNQITYFDDGLVADTNSISSTYFDAWYTFEFRRDNDYGTDFGYLFANTTQVDYGDMIPDTSTDNWFYLWCRDTEYDLYSDWIAGRKFVTGDPAQTASIGSEESTVEWVEVGRATVYLNVPFDMWGFNGALIILGLIMIPASGAYLVWGGRKDLDQDKLFMALIMFCMGWGLLIGGIMP